MTGAVAVDPQRFRQVLGNYLTGVTVVTAIDAPAFVATQVHHDPSDFLGDRSHRRVQLFATVTSLRTEHVTGLNRPGELAAHPGSS